MSVLSGIHMVIDAIRSYNLIIFDWQIPILTFFFYILMRFCLMCNTRSIDCIELYILIRTDKFIMQ